MNLFNKVLGGGYKENIEKTPTEIKTEITKIITGLGQFNSKENKEKSYKKYLEYLEENNINPNTPKGKEIIGENNLKRVNNYIKESSIIEENTNNFKSKVEDIKEKGELENSFKKYINCKYKSGGCSEPFVIKNTFAKQQILIFLKKINKNPDVSGVFSFLKTNKEIEEIVDDLIENKGCPLNFGNIQIKLEK